MLQITIEQVGFEEVRAGFDRLISGVSDLRGVWPEVRRYFHSTEEELFSSQGSSGQTKGWPALSPAYAAWKAKKFPGKGILVRTGALKDSLTGHGGSKVTMKPLEFSEFSEVTYGKYHASRSGPLKFRPPVSLTDRDAAEIGAIIARYVRRLARESFRQKVGV